MAKWSSAFRFSFLIVIDGRAVVTLEERISVKYLEWFCRFHTAALPLHLLQLCHSRAEHLPNVPPKWAFQGLGKGWAGSFLPVQIKMRTYGDIQTQILPFSGVKNDLEMLLWLVIHKKWVYSKRNSLTGATLWGNTGKSCHFFTNIFQNHANIAGMCEFRKDWSRHCTFVLFYCHISWETSLEIKRCWSLKESCNTV